MSEEWSAVRWLRQRTAMVWYPSGTDLVAVIFPATGSPPRPCDGCEPATALGLALGSGPSRAIGHAEAGQLSSVPIARIEEVGFLAAASELLRMELQA